MNTRTQGLTGEDLASSYLAKKGYTIIARNFRIRNGELDIVTLDPQRKILVFVEVKTRTSNQFGTPFESITPRKLRFLIRAAQFYKISHKNLPDSMRIDAISVEFNHEGSEKIEHLENISGF